MEQRCSVTCTFVALECSAVKKVTTATTLPSPSSSSCGVALQRSVTKKATAITVPSPLSSFFYSGRKPDFENKLSFVVIAFFFFPCSITKKVTVVAFFLSFFATERRRQQW
jgi:hypothetical protein